MDFGKDTVDGGKGEKGSRVDSGRAFNSSELLKHG